MLCECSLSALSSLSQCCLSSECSVSICWLRICACERHAGWAIPAWPCRMAHAGWTMTDGVSWMGHAGGAMPDGPCRMSKAGWAMPDEQCRMGHAGWAMPGVHSVIPDGPFRMGHPGWVLRESTRYFLEVTNDHMQAVPTARTPWWGPYRIDRAVWPCPMLGGTCTLDYLSRAFGTMGL